jgi:hypothetical protein
VSNWAVRQGDRFGRVAWSAQSSQYAAACRNRRNWLAVALLHEVRSAARCRLEPILRRIERGEISALEAIDALLGEELTGMARRAARRDPPSPPWASARPRWTSASRAVRRFLNGAAAGSRSAKIRRGQEAVVHCICARKACAPRMRMDQSTFSIDTGVGKTHLAVGLSLKAIEHGYRVLFTTAAQMIVTLTRALNESRLEERLKSYTMPRLLIVDEIGYLRIDRAGANLVFQLISRRYEKGPMILTSNQSFGAWGDVFGDRVIATAILDRVLHHSVTLNIRGNSYRLKDKLKAGLVRSPEQPLTET